MSDNENEAKSGYDPRLSSGQAKDLSMSSYFVLAVIVPFGTALVKWPHHPAIVVVLALWVWQSIFFMCFGSVLIFRAGEHISRYHALTGHLTRNYPWPENRSHELEKLVRQVSESGYLAWASEWKGMELCKTGLVFALLGLMASPLIIFLNP